jgi:response regulator NasT
VKPFQKSELIPAIEVALGRFSELKALEAENRGLEGQNRSLEDLLERQRLVDRAKGLLMDNHAMKEADAFSFIQRTAMRLRLTMKEVARQVIDGSLTP